MSSSPITNPKFVGQTISTGWFLLNFGYHIIVYLQAGSPHKCPHPQLRQSIFLELKPWCNSILKTQSSNFLLNSNKINIFRIKHNQNTKNYVWYKNKWTKFTRIKILMWLVNNLSANDILNAAIHYERVELDQSINNIIPKPRLVNNWTFLYLKKKQLR